SSRYSERKVITRARSPVMPKTTNTSAARAGPAARGAAPERGRGRTAVAMSVPSKIAAFPGASSRAVQRRSSPHPGEGLSGALAQGVEGVGARGVQREEIVGAGDPERQRHRALRPARDGQAPVGLG